MLLVTFCGIFGIGWFCGSACWGCGLFFDFVLVLDVLVCWGVVVVFGVVVVLILV